MDAWNQSVYQFFGPSVRQAASWLLGCFVGLVCESVYEWVGGSVGQLVDWWVGDSVDLWVGSGEQAGKERGCQDDP